MFSQEPPVELLAQNELVQRKERKFSRDFSQPNLTLKTQPEILEFYKEKKDFLSSLENTDQDQIELQATNTIVEVLFFLKQDPSFLSSEAFQYVDTNLTELVIDFDIATVVSKVLAQEAEVDLSLLSFNFANLKEIAAAHSTQPEKIAFFQKLMSQDQIEESERETVLAFFDITDSLDLAAQNGALSSEKIAVLLESDYATDFLRMAFLQLDTFDAKTKQAFFTQVATVDGRELTNCAIEFSRNRQLAPELFQFLGVLDSYSIKLVITSLLDNNLLESAAPHFEDVWPDSDVVYALLMYEKQDVARTDFGIELLRKLVTTKEEQQKFINQFIHAKGFDQFLSNEQVLGLLDVDLELSREWFLQFFGSIKYSSKNGLHTIPDKFGELFELHESISLTDITLDNYSEKDIHLPEKWRRKVAAQNLTKEAAESLLRRIANGRRESILAIGGDELLTKVLEYEHSEYTLSYILNDCVEKGWAKTPQELQELLKNHVWKIFPTDLLKTNDVTTIAIVAGNSRATVADIAGYLEKKDVPLVSAFFKGCTQSDVQTAVDSDLFQEEYPEYVAYIESLTALGEKAMVVRCAVKGIPLTEVDDLIELARVQKHTLYKTTAFLTGIHETDIYWEDRPDRTIEGLYWDEELKRHVLSDASERISAQDLKNHILMNANPQDYESVFFLLNLAQEENNSLLKEGEQFSQSDYKYIFDSFVARTVSAIDILKELGTRAGYEKPEDYEQALVDSLNGYPSAASLENILNLSEGTITPARFKELSYKYLDTEIRFSPDACKVLFDYALSIDEPYTQDEKLRFWNKFVSDFDTKDNISTLGADEVKIFLDEAVIDGQEARKLLGKYVLHGKVRTTELRKLFDYTITSQDQVEELLARYTESVGSLELQVLEGFREFITDKGYESPEISAHFSRYIDQKISFDYLVAYLKKFEAYVTPEQVKNKVIQIAVTGERISDDLLDLMQQYEFDAAECQVLCEVAISKHRISAEVFVQLHKKAEYSEDQNLEFVQRVLLDPDAQIDSILEYLCKNIDPKTVHEIAIEYAVSYKEIDKQYLNALKSVIKAVDSQLLASFNKAIREKDDRVTFFDNSQLMEEQLGSSQESTNYTEIYTGLPAVELEDELSNLQENRVFLVNNLVFSENKGKFSPQALQTILGKDIVSALAQLKESIAQNVVDADDDWMLQREAAFSKFKVLSHGTGQVLNRKKGVASETEESLHSPEAVVQVIVDGENGIGIRGEKATVGAFFNPGANGLYGGVDSGSAVLFFTDDLISSHVTIATDPMGADGHVGIDVASKKYVQIPNRALLNPQAGEIEGVSLDHGQMGNYVLELRNILEKNPQLSNLVFETATKHLQEKYPQSVTVLKEIHTIQRKQGYPEAAILWTRDYYLSLRLSDSQSDQKLAGVVEKIVSGISSGVLEGDLRSYIDMVRLNWDSDLEKLSENPLGFAQLLATASQKMQDRQRGRFITAAEQLKSRRTESKRVRSGVAKQHMLQVQSAERYGDVQPRNITDNLRTTRALFMDTQDSKGYVTALNEVKEYSEYMQAVKESALLRTYQEGIDSLSQVDRVVFDKYQSKISVCSSGSIGRGEVVISSDIDYLVLVDDSELESGDVDKIKRVLFKIGEKMNQQMADDFKIRPDAGLANKDKQPIVLYSKVDSFLLDKSGDRQVLEPSEMMDIAAVDGKEALVTEFKRRFVTRSQELIQAEDSASLFEYMDSKVASFDTMFNGGLSQLLSRDQLIDFKMQVQRIFNFYLYRIVAEKIPEISQSSDTIPNKTLDKIQFMAEKGYISQELSARFYELQLMLYRLRYRADVLNSAQLVEILDKEGRVDERAKIEAKLDPQAISAQELSRFIELISFFSQEVKETRAEKQALPVQELVS